MVGFEKVEKRRVPFAVKCKYTKCTRMVSERILAQKQIHEKYSIYKNYNYL
jgi:hypothetical protein